MAHSLQIDRVVSEWLLPRDQPQDALSLDELSELATRHLPGALANLLEPLCAEHDESIWLIRRLDVSFGTDLAWGDTKVARQWAANVAQSLIRTMQGEPDSQSVFHYRSRAEYMAAFVTDVAFGSAWNKWQYGSFLGLSPLSPSAVVCTLLVSEPSVALAALAMLTSSTLRRVLASLHADDAAQVWRRLTSPVVSPRASTLGRVLDAWESDREAIASSGCPERDSLGLLVRALRNEPDVENQWRETAWAAAAATALENLRNSTPAEQWSEVKTMLLSGRIADIASFHRPAGEGLAIWTAHRDLLERAVGTLTGKTAGEEPSGEFRSTAFGGVFLLLPLIESLPAEDWSEQPGLLRFGIFVQCCAAGARAAARADFLLRDLFGISPEFGLEQLQLGANADDVWAWIRRDEHPAQNVAYDTEYLGTCDAVSAAAHSVLRRFAWKLPGFGTCGLRHLWSNFLDFPARAEFQPQRIVVRMGSPPLHVVLRLSGLASGSYTLPGIDPRPFHLFPED